MTDEHALRRQLTQCLESLQRAGVSHLPRVPVFAPTAQSAQLVPPERRIDQDQVPERSPAVSARPSAARPTTGAVAPAPAPPGPAPLSVPSPPTPASPAMPRPAARPRPSDSVAAGEALSLEARQQEFTALCAEVRQCRRCPVLVANRTQTVFGVGNLQPRLCFFGEAPGADEDAQGEPFVGRAGELLNKMIEAMSLRRADVYILNVLKCRPPGNRAPLPEEAENCRPFFERQLEVLRPEFICCLGASAAQALLKTKFSIGKLRGQWYTHGPSQVLATYHPAYLLRNPAAKRPVWEDLQLLMAAMGLQQKM